ncbi:unnamed protein product [Dovyalis caffra]|uniref:Uncharacterized protein n=1 Tax=Dovyalis caffra TaxID=77055 RepID=A0AAV1RRA5_9ROSI|nr:unnamed protein product [Dovyalis caffra]
MWRRVSFQEGPQSGTDHEKATSTGTAAAEEFRFIISKKTESSDQEDAKSTNSSVDEFLNPLGILLPKKKRRMTEQKFVKKNHHYISSYRDGLKLKIERRVEEREHQRKERRWEG